MSQLMASSQPPPSANPRTAAINGRPTAHRRSQAPKRPPSRSEADDCGASSRMSAPAAKARLPEPVITTARVSPSASSDSSAEARASSRSKLRALSASRRSIVTRATPSSCCSGSRGRRRGSRGRRRARARGRRGADASTAESRCAGALVTDDPRLRSRQYPRVGKPRRSISGASRSADGRRVRRDGFGRTIEVRERLVDDRGTLAQDLMPAIRRHQQPPVVQLPGEAPGLVDRHERVSIAADHQGRRRDRVQLVRLEQRLRWRRHGRWPGAADARHPGPARDRAAGRAGLPRWDRRARSGPGRAAGGRRWSAAPGPRRRRRRPGCGSVPVGEWRSRAPSTRPSRSP